MVKNIFIIAVKRRMNNIGLSDFTTIFNGIDDAATSRAADIKRTAKLITFLHKNEQVIYKIAIITLHLASRLCIGERAG